MISPTRRFVLAGTALALSALLFHAQLASALVTRGDDALRTGDLAGAVRYYRRATAFDPRSSTAADRLAFALVQRRTRDDAHAAIAVATAAIGGQLPRDSALLADRAWAEQQLGAWPAAERDFASAGRAGRDARYDHLAARIALALGDRVAARRLFATALEHDPRFDPARVALAELR